MTPVTHRTIRAVIDIHLTQKEGEDAVIESICLKGQAGIRVMTERSARAKELK